MKDDLVRLNNKMLENINRHTNLYTHERPLYHLMYIYYFIITDALCAYVAPNSATHSLERTSTRPTYSRAVLPRH